MVKEFQDPISPSVIEHAVDEDWEDGKQLYRYNYLDYHFEGFGAYCRARSYVDNFREVVIFGPFVSKGDIQSAAAPELLNAVTAYLKRRFQRVDRSY